MKKIFIILIFSCLGLISINLKAQNCDDCLYPHFCSQINANTPCGTVTLVICYKCDAGGNSTQADILRIIAPAGCNVNSDEFWDSCYTAIIYRSHELCGYTPCPQKKLIEITRPICMKVTYDPANYWLTFEKNLHDCPARITCFYDVCVIYTPQPVLKVFYLMNTKSDYPPCAKLPLPYLGETPWTVDCFYTNENCPANINW